MGDVRGGDGASSEDELRREAGRMLDMLRDPEMVSLLSEDELAAVGGVAAWGVRADAAR